MEIHILQPPVMQCNTPYPSGAYLSAFFEQCKQKFPGRITTVKWHDLNIQLFHALFSKKGLEKLFMLSEERALKQADQAERCGDEYTAFNLRRYISESSAWVMWIDTIVDILCGKSQELRHEFVRSAYIPRGNRMENYLASLGRDVSADDARLLASFALADIADYITVVFDREFSLVRYAESLAVETASLDTVIKCLKSPVLTEFYIPLLNTVLDRIAASCTAIKGIDILFCISVPFAGTFAPALASAGEIRKRFGSDACCILGGGYINTDLRRITDPELFNYIDILSYDRGYGSYYSLFDAGLGSDAVDNTEELFTALRQNGGYKLRWYDSVAGCVCGNADCGFGGTENTAEICTQRYAAYEDKLTVHIIPDYTSVDFSQYPRLADDVNPMHRLWSDGAWIKAYLAHGCYWHRCAFCDVTLDYVCAYRMTDIRRLHDGLSVQVRKTGVRGIHFVDEAAPPAALARFALYNTGEERFSFWGNIRFEKTFSRDLVDFLAYGGLCGVSGGIEIASAAGLESVHKGTDIQNLVAACAAFKEAGILVHGYMIFGYWQETPEMLADSMETLRQLFAAGVLDSSFWHKFTLTRHSRVYSEWKSGKHPSLKPVEPKSRDDNGRRPFAENALFFKGERFSQRYAAGLDAALSAWLHGVELDKPVSSWFRFPFPHPSVTDDYIMKQIELYERQRDKAFSERYNDRFVYIWIGGKPFTAAGEDICWMYMGEINYCTSPNPTAVAALLWELRPRPDISILQQSRMLVRQIPEMVFRKIRGRGLCRLEHSLLQ